MSQPEMVPAGDLVLRTDERLAVCEVDVGSRSDLIGRQLVDLFDSPSHGRVADAVERVLRTGRVQRLVARARGWSTNAFALWVAAIDTERGRALLVSGIEVDDGPAARSILERVPHDPVWDLVDELPVAVFIKDRDCRFTYGNRVFLASLGVSSIDDIRGKDDFEFHRAPEAIGYRRDDQEVMRTGRAITEMGENQTRSDGRVELLRTTKLPIRDVDGTVVGLFGVFTEITEPTRVAEALRTSEQRFALAVQATRDGIWDFDLEANSFHFSPRALELLDLPPGRSEVPWREVAAMFGRETAVQMVEAVERLQRDPTATLTYTTSFQRADGSLRWLEMCGAALAVGGVTNRIVGAAADITEERQREAELRRQALHDDLTALSNRRALFTHLEDLLESDRAFSLLYLDLDSFKVVNDSLGHEAGDTMLRVVGQRLTGLVAPSDMVARLGGDEFAIVAVGPDHRARAIDLASSAIARALADPILIGTVEVYTAASVGVVLNSQSYRTGQTMLRDADTAMYQAKDGQVGYTVFETRMGRAAIEALQTQTRLRRAVDNDEFELLYQPVYASADLEMVSVEALLRWRPSPDELVAPDQFLPYLERSGLIVDVGAWVIDAGCAQLAALHRTEPRLASVSLALNLSRIQFAVPGLAATVWDALDRHGLEPEQLIVEVTESAVAGDASQVVAGLAELRERGIRVALDDFGVGQSSLSQLHELPLDILKIDRTFISRIAERDDEPVLEASLRIAEALGLLTVAEGVETARQIDWLRDRRCDLLQGYGLSRPVTAEHVRDGIDPAP